MLCLHFVAVLAWFSYFTVETLAANVNASSVPLRIMALGASVTFGIGSTTGDSYRKDLEDLLVANGNTVEYVGSKKHGNFTDNAVEATSGFVISQIAAAAKVSVPMRKPNLVLIDAGTNNCNKGGTVPDAGANVTNMINEVFAQSPGATVVLTTILVNSVAAQDACRVTVNAQYTALAKTMQAAGAKLVLVDMRASGGPLVTDLFDGRHPNDGGYVKMANIWFGGIQEVIIKGFLTAPSAVANSTSSASASESSGNGKGKGHSKGNSTMSSTPSHNSTSSADKGKGKGKNNSTMSSTPTSNSMMASATSQGSPAKSSQPALLTTSAGIRTSENMLPAAIIPLLITMSWCL